MTTTTTYTVVGMTCGHCVGAVTDALSKIPGVIDIDVDLGTGTVDVTSASPIETTTVRAAVEDAGYELART